MSYNKDLIDFLLSKYKILKEEKVLDIGYGNGYLLKTLGREKYGIEKGDKLIEENYDYVFMLDVIEHLTVKEVQDYFNYFKRALNKNGKIIISTPNTHNLYQMIYFWDELSHLRPYTIQTMLNLGRDYNYEVEVFPFHYFKNPLKILINSLLGLDSYNKNIFELTRKKIKKTH